VSLDVSLQLELGDFHLQVEFSAFQGITALFGPSGAGKTLTLRCVAGLTRPTSGRIELDQRPLFDSRRGIDVPARHRRVGYVFQQYALFPHLDVLRNVAFGISGVSRPQREERARRLLALVGLEEFGARQIRGLSGGQQQRVALARALATEPDLLLLDEPFAAVDFRVRARLRDELRRIHQATCTPMLLVTHDIAEVRQLADFVVLMDAGHVIQSGTTGAVLADPQDPDLAALLGVSTG
jgi:molybdate transport system ATP-binding protein